MKSSEEMSELSDESVDLVITSIPEVHYFETGRWVPGIGGDYFAKNFAEIHRVMKDGKFFVLNVGVPAFPKDQDPLMLPFHELRSRMRHKVCYPYLVLCGIMDAAPFVPVGDIIAIYRNHKYKVNENPRIAASQVAIGCDHCLLLAKGKWLSFENPVGNLILQESFTSSFDESLVREFILGLSKSGETVLDPFAGTGTLGKVAMETGRNSVMYEIGPKYVETARAKVPGLEIYRKDGDKRPS